MACPLKKQRQYSTMMILFSLMTPDHSVGEERFLIIGVTDTEKLCIVSHCYRDEDVIRIISARKATKHEKQIYWDNLVGRL